jgi:hypothetical protein
LIEEAQQSLLPGQVSYIPEENAALQGLGRVNSDLVRELARRGRVVEYDPATSRYTLPREHAGFLSTVREIPAFSRGDGRG